jgi:hypothetical protein
MNYRTNKRLSIKEKYKIPPPYGLVFHKGDFSVYKYPEQIQIKVGVSLIGLSNTTDIKNLLKAIKI